jgi:F0F1-type ATP synthase assembly protein I
VLIGVAGMVLIVAAWLLSLKDVPSPRLSALYGVGSALLTVHSLTIGDPVFSILNAAATALALINLARWFRGRGAKQL